MNHLLSWIIWLPVIGMVAITFISRDKTALIKRKYLLLLRGISWC
jgi:NADH:ubiquinone oxidoreductase subunit 4 (subunit M)